MKPVLLLTLMLLLFTPAQAEQFPKMQFEDIFGNIVHLGEVSEKPKIIILSKPGLSNRRHNVAWLENILKATDRETGPTIHMISDFTGLPGFINKDSLRRKMLEKSKGPEKKALERLLFDWHGDARPILEKDSQIHVFVVDPKNEIRKIVYGFYKPKKVDLVLEALKGL